MTALSGLFKKEFCLIRTSASVIAVVFLVYYIGLFVAAKYYSSESLAFFSMFPLGVSFWFVPAFLMTSLREERHKIHVWLHNPQAAWKLLGVKFAVALILSLGLHVLVLAGKSVYILTFLRGSELFVSLGWREHVLIGMVMILISSYVAIWFMFGWAVFHVLKRFVKKWSLPVTMGLLAGMIILLVNIEMSDWFAQLTHWGTVLHAPVGIEGNMRGSGGTFEVQVAVAENISVYHLLYHAGIASLLFYLSCRLIDQKVEV